jgi:hypothetical protein
MSHVSYTKYRCYYKKVFPLDEFGRLGGEYSLADLPVDRYEELSRPGVVEALNEEHQSYYVKDQEKEFRVWVPIKNVALGVVIDEE